MKSERYYFWLFFCISVLVPALTFVAILYFNRSSEVGFVEFFRLNRSLGNLSALLSVSVLPNLILFYFTVNSEKWAAVRGILFGTILYALPVFLLKEW